MPKKRFGKAKMKKMWFSFRPWFSSGLWHCVLINKNWKMYETAIPMGNMLNAFLAIHGRWTFIIFLRGQTPSLSAPTLILSLMEHFQGKAKNAVKHSIKSTFSISIQLNCNRLPGNPQLPPYIYIYIHTGDKCPVQGRFQHISPVTWTQSVLIYIFTIISHYISIL